MSPLRRRLLREQDGITSTVAIMVLGLLLALAAGMFAQVAFLTNSEQTDTSSKRGLQAAQAGLDTALNRLAILKPADTSCITDVLAAPDGTGWCAATTQEAIGHHQTFSYRVSKSPPSGGCAGEALAAGQGDRCIVATGYASGRQMRLETRVGRITTPNPFSITSTTSLIGYKSIRLKNGSSVTGDSSTNGEFKIDGTATYSGTVYLGPKGKVKHFSGTVVRNATPFVPTLPNFGNTALVNNNLNLGNQVTSSGKGTYNATTRTLTINDGASVTAQAGSYNFCKLVLGKNAKINIAGGLSGAPPPAAKFYIDSKDRLGSRCTDKGTLDAKGGSSFVNPNSDPRTLQLYAWSNRTNLKVPNGKDIKMVIYAPQSNVSFSSKGKITGGVAASKIQLNKSQQIVYSTLVTTSASLVSVVDAAQVVSWRQCKSTQPSPTDPNSGC